jgi:hypothetical protein
MGALDFPLWSEIQVGYTVGRLISSLASVVKLIFHVPMLEPPDKSASFAGGPSAKIAAHTPPQNNDRILALVIDWFADGCDLDEPFDVIKLFLMPRFPLKFNVFLREIPQDGRKRARLESLRARNLLEDDSRASVRVDDDTLPALALYRHTWLFHTYIPTQRIRFADDRFSFFSLAILQPTPTLCIS